MARPFVTIPWEFMTSVAFDWDIDWRGQRSGEALDGVSQTVVNAHPVWRGAPQMVLHGEALKRWRATRWQAQGLAGLYRVPIFDPLFPPPNVPADVPYSTGVRHSTGAGFFYGPAYVVAEAAAIGDKSILIEVPDSLPAPELGRIVSGPQDFPLGIGSVEPAPEGRYRIEVAPWVRTALAVGDLLALKAFGRFEAIEDGAGNPDFGLIPVARPSIAFREWVRRDAA